MSEIRVSYNRPVNGTYGMSVNGTPVPSAKVTKVDGGFELVWHGEPTWHRTMKAVRLFMTAAFAAKAVSLPVASMRESAAHDFTALAAASKRARTTG